MSYTPSIPALPPASVVAFPAAPNPAAADKNVHILDPVEWPELGSQGNNGCKSPAQHAALFVGDLHQEVSEGVLYTIFEKFGRIIKIRIARDPDTRRSLGYAYVYFAFVNDAASALKAMNFYISAQNRNRPLRLMWKMRDPAQRRTGECNIFIKGLHRSIDDEALFDTFSQFGPILSAKVAMNYARQSLGYGWILFESREVAAGAIHRVNGMLINGKKVTVEKFIPKSVRDVAHYSNKPFTNLYIKQLDTSRCNEAGLRKIFEEFGTITSLYVPKKTNGSALGYAFVNFESYLSAQKAVDEMNGKEIDGVKLFVGRAQNKEERAAEIRTSYEKERHEKERKRRRSNYSHN